MNTGLSFFLLFSGNPGKKPNGTPRSFGGDPHSQSSSKLLASIETLEPLKGSETGDSASKFRFLCLQPSGNFNGEKILWPPFLVGWCLKTPPQKKEEEGKHNHQIITITQIKDPPQTKTHRNRWHLEREAKWVDTPGCGADRLGSEVRLDMRSERT